MYCARRSIALEISREVRAPRPAWGLAHALAPPRGVAGRARGRARSSALSARAPLARRGRALVRMRAHVVYSIYMLRPCMPRAGLEVFENMLVGNSKKDLSQQCPDCSGCGHQTCAHAPCAWSHLCARGTGQPPVVWLTHHCHCSAVHHLAAARCVPGARLK